MTETVRLSLFNRFSLCSSKLPFDPAKCSTKTDTESLNASISNTPRQESNDKNNDGEKNQRLTVRN
jgi:hypothetical protein